MRQADALLDETVEELEDLINDDRSQAHRGPSSSMTMGARLA